MSESSPAKAQEHTAMSTTMVKFFMRIVRLVSGRRRGRSASYPTAPSRIPACSFPAPGSSELFASALVQWYWLSPLLPAVRLASRTRLAAGNHGASQLPDSSLVPCHSLGPRQAFGSLTFYGCSVWASRIVNWVATCFHFLCHGAGLL